MYCTNCGTKVNCEEEFCAECGAAQKNGYQNYCFMCGEKLEPESKFCTNCGTAFADNDAPVESITEVGTENAAEEIVNKPGKKEFAIVNAVKKDLEASETAKILKNKTKEMTDTISKTVKEKSEKPGFTGKVKKIAAVLAAVVAVVVIATSIHTCEECGEVYFGREHTISLFGEHEDVCKECYNDFYCW